MISNFTEHTPAPCTLLGCARAGEHCICGLDWADGLHTAA